MSTACPFCGQPQRDLFALSLHLDDDHPGREGELVVAIAPELRAVPIFECDIDKVHRSRAAPALCC
ncbi:MAG: hypothetical protein SHS37scaffold220_27 [Phage 67_12]|nr:MAG: hypothetical protein SHS37scaffold220_27 [Phage 67_12]